MLKTFVSLEKNFNGRISSIIIHGILSILLMNVYRIIITYKLADIMTNRLKYFFFFSISAWNMFTTPSILFDSGFTFPANKIYK